MAQFWFLYALLFCHILAAVPRGRLKTLTFVAMAGFAAHLCVPPQLDAFHLQWERPVFALALHNVPLYVAGI